MNQILGLNPAPSNYSAQNWLAYCQQAAQAASLGCGQSDILWSRNLAARIELYLVKIPNEHRTEALKIAKSCGYSDEPEILDDDCCAHGFDFDCCPLGCGEF